VRVSEGKAFPPLDASRYRLDPQPQNRRGDAVAWRACLDNARAQLEHQANRCVNLELALRFGARAAEAGAAHSAASAALLRSEARAALARVEAVNRRRKLEQEKAAEEAGEHEGRWVRGVRKCAEIEAACARLEEEVAALAAEAGGQQQGAKKKREEEGGEREGEKGHGKKSNNSDNNFGLPALPGGGEGEEEEEARR
jgi:pre-mRNA-splicing factor SPF27